MKSEEFLDNLLLGLGAKNGNFINVGFDEISKNHLLMLLSNSEIKKKIICISSNNFHENTDKIFALNNKNELESIISLPIFKDDDNLIILIFKTDKQSDKCLFIDESDSLLHKKDDVDWTYANRELIPKITRTYDEFIENDTSVYIDINQIFPKHPEKKFHDELLSLKEDLETPLPRKNRVASAEMSDELLALNNDLHSPYPMKRRVISDEISDGLLSLKQKQSVRDEIAKHDIKSMEPSSKSTNFPFLNDAMYYKKRQNPENLLYKDNKPLIDGEVSFKELGEIADLHNIYSKNNNESILIATCKRCDSKIVYYNKDITDFKGEVFIELINISNEVSIDYLYEYLISSNGLDELSYFSKGNHYITPDDIKNVKVPVPDLKVQREIVKVSRESREFFKTVELLKKEYDSNILDYKHMKNSLDEFKGQIEFDNDTNEITRLSRSWRHAYKGLIWPLAISYLSATKGGFEIVEKKNNYLILFEFIAAFNTIILISGLPEDVYQDNFSRIWNSRNPHEYKQMTFSNWVILSQNLSDVYKYNNFQSKLDEELFDKIASDKILNILGFARDLRNNESHGSQSNAYEAKQIVEKLDVYLEDLFDILEIYSNYKLIYTTGDVKSSKQAYNHRVILLNGPCAQPIYDNIIFDTLLESESLYLYNPKNNKKLLLNDNFIKFSPTDKHKKNWALFIYYSCHKNGHKAYYKCFQSKEKDIKVNISSLKRDILGKK